jgi:glyoxylase-like metal-dependent hydrolase (beta-lactamase superfamily II)
MSEVYEVYAIRYATMTNRYRRDNFIIPGDAHDIPMPIDYFIWVIRNSDRTIVVDTGFDPVEGKKRGREVIRLPREGLAMLGIDATSIKDVVITHMHYDHAGTLDDFPAASFHVQEKELQFATGRHMCHDPIRHTFSVDHVCGMVRRLFEGRVRFCDGSAEIAPGVELHHVGGHTLGLQCVRVQTARGPLVLCSDASHFYENMEKVSPFPIVFDMGDVLQGYRTLRKLATSSDHLIPGHDPQVMDRYPPPEPMLTGTIARLDVSPRPCPPN